MGYKLLTGLGQKEEIVANNQNMPMAQIESPPPQDFHRMAVKSSQNVGGSVGQQLASREDRHLTEEMLKPTIDGRVESKPIYDNVRQVRQMEYPVACISGGNSGCSCYSSQGSAIKEIDTKKCNEYVKNGLPFNPNKEKRIDVSNDEVVEKPSASKDDSAVLVMGGKSQQNLMYDGYVEAGKEFNPNGGVVGSN